MVSKKLVATAIGGLLLAASYAPVWAGSADTAAPSTQSAASGTTNNSVLGALTPLFADVVEHKAQPNCKADTLYSGHDVIGDSEACLISHVDARATGVNPGVSGAL